MLLQLVGGAQRLSPQNSHQTPSVVVLCGGGISACVGGCATSPILDSPSTIGLAIARFAAVEFVKFSTLIVSSPSTSLLPICVWVVLSHCEVSVDVNICHSFLHFPISIFFFLLPILSLLLSNISRWSYFFLLFLSFPNAVVLYPITICSFRNLANHRVGVVVCVPQKFVDSQTKMTNSLLATEAKLLKLTDAKIVHSINGNNLLLLLSCCCCCCCSSCCCFPFSPSVFVISQVTHFYFSQQFVLRSDLPSTPTDVIVSALDVTSGAADEWYRSVTLWANQNKAPILAVDPNGVDSLKRVS